MASKTDVQVLLGGKVYTLSGYESEEYLQKIALYINNKMTELNQMPGYKRMGSDEGRLALLYTLMVGFGWWGYLCEEGAFDR